MLKKVLVEGASHKGDREINEDSWAVVQFPMGGRPRRGEKPKVGTLAVVADGLGGEKNGRAASMTAVRVCQTMDMPGLLAASSNRQKALDPLFAKANMAAQKAEGYTTLVALLALPDEPIYIAWAGDSAVWWLAPRRRSWERLTRPHGIGSHLSNFLGKPDRGQARLMFVEHLESMPTGIYLVTSDGMDPILEKGAGSRWAVDRETSAAEAVRHAIDAPWVAHHDNATCIRLDLR